MPLSQPDFDLLRKAQRGDERAFRVIVETYETPVFNYVLRMVGDRALAEDLTQEIFLRIYQGLAGFSLRCRFTTWLFQVAKNRVLDELRARERKPQSFLTLDDMPPLEVVDAPPERVEIIDAVWRAVAALNPDLKMALLLRDIVGLSYTEIADSLEITLATVKWRIFKAREEVQLALAREGVEVEFEADFFGVRYAGPFATFPQTFMSAPFCAARTQHCAATACFHAHAESVRALAAGGRRLIGAFHDLCLSSW